MLVPWRISQDIPRSTLSVESSKEPTATEPMEPVTTGAGHWGGLDLQREKISEVLGNQRWLVRALGVCFKDLCDV